VLFILGLSTLIPMGFFGFFLFSPSASIPMDFFGFVFFSLSASIPMGFFRFFLYPPAYSSASLVFLHLGLESGYGILGACGSCPLLLQFLGCLFCPVDLLLQLCRLFAVKFIQAGEVDGQVGDCIF